MPDESTPLAGVGVLVTRPVRQAQHLAESLERMGARVLRFPLMVLAPPSNPNLAQSRLAELDGPDTRADWVIVVSANALHFAADLLPELMTHLRNVSIACLGEATATTVRDAGLDPHLVPESGSTSEDLLALHELRSTRIGGRRVVILKGEGGRDVLARTLTDRGADVHTIETYRRLPPGGDLAAFLDAHAGELGLAVITSGEALERFVASARPQQVADLPLVLPSERVRARAGALGLHGPFAVPPHMSDAALAAAAAGLADATRRH